jgi:pteridine reductase
MTIKRNKILDQPVFLVTGGASPIGEAITRQIVKEGGAVAVHYQKSFSRAQKLCMELKSQGASIILCPADLSYPDQTGRLIRQVVRQWGRMDVLVNSASLFMPTPPEKTQSTVWERIFRINTLSPYFLSTAALPWLRKARGAVVHITDIYGSHPLLKGYGAYSASKAALIALTRLMASEMGPEVRVNAVSPGAITFPTGYSHARKRKVLQNSILGRIGQPEDIAAAVMFAARHPFLTGQVLNVDGGRFSE